MQSVPQLPSAKKILLLAEDPVYSPLPPPPPPIPNFRIIDNGDFRITDNGDFRIVNL